MEEGSVYRLVRNSKEALSEKVARAILDLITTRELRVGDRLPPSDELAKLLGVSRSSLREAMRVLDSWGVVTVKHGVGTFVSEVQEDTLAVPIELSAGRDEDTFYRLYQLREALEPTIAALAAQNATPQHLEEMERALDRMDQSLEDPDDFIEADLAFHSALAKATGNDLFLIVLHPVINLLQEQRRLVIQTPADAQRPQASHWTIFNYVKAGDADGARNASRRALNDILREIERRIRQQG